MPEQIIALVAWPLPGIPWPVALARMAAALAFGACMGWEREMHARAAGLRTHMLIALAACLFSLVSYALAAFPADDSLRVDPLRLIEAVTAGVAFLAAGSIITSGGRVTGLTTGAGMWLAGAIGMTCGIGQIALAGMATALALLVLWAVRRLAIRAGTP